MRQPYGGMAVVPALQLRKVTCVEATQLPALQAAILQPKLKSRSLTLTLSSCGRYMCQNITLGPINRFSYYVPTKKKQKPVFHHKGSSVFLCLAQQKEQNQSYGCLTLRGARLPHTYS